MATVTVGSDNGSLVELYYEDRGAGRPVVPIQGLLQDCRSGERQVAALLAAGYRVISYDRRGFGRSSRPVNGYDFDTLASDLDALLAHLGLADVVPIGFSVGTGEVARFLASYASVRVSKAVMVGAIPPFLLGAVPGRVFYGMKKSITADRDVFITAFLNDAYNFDVLAGIRITEQEWHANRVIAAGASDHVTSACIDAGLTDFRADIPATDVPTLGVHGTADRILPIDATARLLPDLNTNVTVVEVDGAPHGLARTHPAEVNQAILAFLEN
jgi:non-heme chloroperoxidase